MTLACRRVLAAAWMFALVAGSIGCEDDPPTNRFQGYVEAEFVKVASGVAGTLDLVEVERGERVQADALLFELDDTPQVSALNEAKAQLAQARATLEDLKKGRRPSEINSIAAQLEQAQVALTLAERELGRIMQLRKTGAATPDQEDTAQSEYDLSRQRVAQQSADLETARLAREPTRSPPLRLPSTPAKRCWLTQNGNWDKLARWRQPPARSSTCCFVAASGFRRENRSWFCCHRSL